MGVTHFGAEHAAALRALELHSFEQQARQDGGAHLAHGRFVGLHNRVPDWPQTLALLGRDEVHVGKAQKRQTVFNRALHQLALVFVDRIPFVHRQHHGAAAFQRVTGDVGVLVRHALLGVEQKQDHIGRLNRLKRFDHRKLLDGFKHFAFAAQTGRVNQLEFLALALKGHADRVTRGARHVKSHQSLFAQPGVDQGGLAHIGATGHSQFDDRGVFFGFFGFVGQMQRLENQFNQTTRSLPVRGRDGDHLAQAQLIKLGQLDALEHALGLVGHQQAGLADLAQVFGNVVVLS